MSETPDTYPLHLFCLHPVGEIPFELPVLLRHHIHDSKTIHFSIFNSCYRAIRTIHLWNIIPSTKGTKPNKKGKNRTETEQPE